MARYPASANLSATFSTQGAMAITSCTMMAAGAFSRDCGYATNDSTLLAPYLTDTHSCRRGERSTAWRAQSWAPREATPTPKPVAAMPMALPSRNRLLETVCISDILERFGPPVQDKRQFQA